jgi:putative ABC transport system permease protein
MDWRLLRGSLWEQRGIAGLAILAVAIGASVASALLHVSGDVERKLRRELKALGPNVLVIPAAARVDPNAPSGVPAVSHRFLMEDRAGASLAAAGVRAVPLLYVSARAITAGVHGALVPTIPIVGTRLDEARALHPSWRLDPARTGAWVGVRLARRIGAGAGSRLQLMPVGPGAAREMEIAATLETGGPDDEALWIPLADAQALGGIPGAVSLYQLRVRDADHARDLARSLGRGSGLEVVPLGALTATEARLLERLRRLMALVTAVALVAAGFCAFGTLTDLALERRRDIALMKALGATRRDVLRQLAAEAVAIGLIGGGLGWLFGLGMAQVIGREVFHSAIALRPDVPVFVLLMSLGVAALASLGPARLALGVEPAIALKED